MGIRYTYPIKSNGNISMRWANSTTSNRDRRKIKIKLINGKLKGFFMYKLLYFCTKRKVGLVIWFVCWYIFLSGDIVEYRIEHLGFAYNNGITEILKEEGGLAIPSLLLSFRNVYDDCLRCTYIYSTKYRLINIGHF